ncbi:MAG: hypothetical protein ACRC1H_07455, partial [Caldilineaceae bacterium]
MAAPSSSPSSQSRNRESIPAPQPPLDGSPVTNQTIINVFARAAATLGSSDPWVLLGRAGLSLDLLVTHRDEPYTGPRFDQIGTLAPDERDALDSALARLIDTRRPVAPVPASGSLRLNAEVMSAALPPTLERTIPTPLPESASAQAQMMARIWNRYGGLLDTVGRILQVDPTLAAGVLAIESGG